MKLKTIHKVESENDLEITGATLLSIEEAKALPDSLSIYSNWWWLRSPNDIFDTDASVVLYIGDEVSIDSDDVSIDSDAVRPALQVKNLESSGLKIGDSIIFDDKEFEIISDTLAFCKTDIGQHCFRENCQAEDANDYEKSDVKKFVDEWFNRIKNI